MSNATDTTSHVGVERTDQTGSSSTNPSPHTSPVSSLFGPHSPTTTANGSPVMGIDNNASTEKNNTSAPRNPDSSDPTGQFAVFREEMTMFRTKNDATIEATKTLLEAAQNHALQLRTLQNEISRIGRENVEFGRENAEFGRENTEFRRKNAEFGRENAEFRRENAELRRENVEFRKELADLRREVADLKRENVEFRKEVDDLRRENSELKRENYQLKRENAQLRSRVEGLELEVGEHKTRIGELEKSNRRLGLSLAEAREDTVLLRNGFTGQVDQFDQLARVARGLEQICSNQSAMEPKITGLF